MRTLATPLLFAAVLAGGATLPAAAQELAGRLEAATGLTCTFHTLATATWAEDGAAGAEVSEAELEVAFANIDTDVGTADAVGRFGDSYVVVRRANDYLHLMQTFSAGPLYTTTVLAQEAGDGRLMAVHTRHEYTTFRLPGFTSRPEMYVGDCAVEE